MNMNLKRIFTSMILALGLTAATAFCAWASQPQGRFEGVDAESVRGWAYDSDTPHKALTVRVSIVSEASGEEVLSRQIAAGEYREELYSRGKGDGCHGFTMTLDWTGLANGDYRIEAYVGDESFSNPLHYTNESGSETDGAAASDPDADTKEAAPALTSLGSFKITGYCPCRSCSGGWGRHTVTGAVATAGRTIAVDPGVIPYGTQVMIGGVIYTAEDRGGGVRGRHIDIFYDTHAETRQSQALQGAEVYLVG